MHDHTKNLSHSAFQMETFKGTQVSFIGNHEITRVCSTGRNHCLALTIRKNIQPYTNLQVATAQLYSSIPNILKDLFIEVSMRCTIAMLYT